ncbi:hypothetical protein BKA24_001761 [Microbacterium marinum]|uniref:Uncharacterized protein n=1 Tax=Microbacterium marinum TaxID=421115 RepID=A0A7W7BQP1_9MICO|nr:hypothetical protein [Microbacterium marinum]MBB4667052.1 hypothetical protein [Microbacterium marinum]
MSYRDTARAFVDAQSAYAFPDRLRAAARALPMSEWAEARRDQMTPQTVAANHAAHVSDAAHALREIIRAYDADAPNYREDELRDAAHALLAAIGEGEL